jgi:hypothetical protein
MPLAASLVSHVEPTHQAIGDSIENEPIEKDSALQVPPKQMQVSAGGDE